MNTTMENANLTIDPSVFVHVKPKSFSGRKKMFELVLDNGKSIRTNSGFELAMFFESRGQLKIAQTGGKSKGARKRRKKKK